MIKVLHVIQGKHFGGAEQVVLTLAKCSDIRRVTSSVCCFDNGLLLEKLSTERIPHYHIPMKSKADILIPLLRMISLVKRKQIDIIHTHTVRSNLIGRIAAFFTGTKCITHLHSPVLRDFADFKRGRINDIIDSTTRPIASKYIAVSHSLRKEMIRRGMRPNKIVTVHNALDLDALESSVSKKNVRGGIRKEYNISTDVPIIVLVALLRPRKGVEVLINATKLVMEKIPTIHLLIVGSSDISEDPDYGNRLRRLTSELDIEANVIFTGFRDDVPAILNRSNLMVLPSLFGEGLPMVILEAMATGVPVVASDVEGIPEIIEDGVTGFLVEAGDPKQLSDKILKVIGNPTLLDKVKRAGQKNVYSEMNGHVQAQKVEMIYKEVLAWNTHPTYPIMRKEQKRL